MRALLKKAISNNKVISPAAPPSPNDLNAPLNCFGYMSNNYESL